MAELSPDLPTDSLCSGPARFLDENASAITGPCERAGDELPVPGGGVKHCAIHKQPRFAYAGSEADGD